MTHSSFHIVTASWAHPIWNQYALIMVDLTTEVPGKPVELIQPGLTHELSVWAMDPKMEFPTGKSTGDLPAGSILSPPNHVFQWAGTNDFADQRVQEIIGWVESMQLNPDSDFIRTWEIIYNDNWYTGRRQ